MPRGVPVATVAIGGAENAAILAAEILAISDENVETKLIEWRKSLTNIVLDDPAAKGNRKGE